MCRDQHGFRVLKEDEIWEAAEEVWRKLPSSKIAQAFVQAHRIAKKVVKNDGGNKFLGVGGSISVGVRKDFVATNSGVVRKDGKHIRAPN